MTITDIISVAGIGIVILGTLSRLAMKHINAVDKRVDEANKKTDDTEEDFKKSKKTLFEKIDQVRDKATADREEMIKQGHSDREEMIEKLHAIKLETSEKYVTMDNHRAGEANFKKDIDTRIGSMERHFDSRFDTLTTLITNSLTKNGKKGD